MADSMGASYPAFDHTPPLEARSMEDIYFPPASQIVVPTELLGDRGVHDDPSKLRHTAYGYVESTADALILMELALLGKLNHVSRRPHDRERDDLITSGRIFIYEESSSGIKRWTDGSCWSPSRIQGNFLIYREMSHPFPTGEKKARKSADRKPTNMSTRSANDVMECLSELNITPSLVANYNAEQLVALERGLVGSLVDSYPFKYDGLIKKTFSIHYHGIMHHLVSYYKAKDIITGHLKRISDIAVGVNPRPELIKDQSYRQPMSMEDLGQLRVSLGVRLRDTPAFHAHMNGENESEEAMSAEEAHYAPHLGHLPMHGRDASISEATRPALFYPPDVTMADEQAAMQSTIYHQLHHQSSDLTGAHQQLHYIHSVPTHGLPSELLPYPYSQNGVAPTEPPRRHSTSEAEYATTQHASVEPLTPPQFQYQVNHTSSYPHSMALTAHATAPNVTASNSFVQVFAHQGLASTENPQSSWSAPPPTAARLNAATAWSSGHLPDVDIPPEGQFGEMRPSLSQASFDQMSGFPDHLDGDDLIHTLHNNTTDNSNNNNINNDTNDRKMN